VSDDYKIMELLSWIMTNFSEMYEYTRCPEKSGPLVKYMYSNSHNTEQKSLKITENTLTSI